MSACQIPRSIDTTMARLVPRIQHQLTGRRLVFNALFYLGHLALFAYGWYGQYRNDRLAILNLLRYSVWTSRGAGLCLAVDGALLFLPGGSDMGEDRSRR